MDGSTTVTISGSRDDRIRFARQRRMECLDLLADAGEALRAAHARAHHDQHQTLSLGEMQAVAHVQARLAEFQAADLAVVDACQHG